MSARRRSACWSRNDGTSLEGFYRRRRASSTAAAVASDSSRMAARVAIFLVVRREPILSTVTPRSPPRRRSTAGPSIFLWCERAHDARAAARSCCCSSGEVPASSTCNDHAGILGEPRGSTYVPEGSSTALGTRTRRPGAGSAAASHQSWSGDDGDVRIRRGAPLILSSLWSPSTTSSSVASSRASICCRQREQLLFVIEIARRVVEPSWASSRNSGA